MVDRGKSSADSHPGSCGLEPTLRVAFRVVQRPRILGEYEERRVTLIDRDSLPTQWDAIVIVFTWNSPLRQISRDKSNWSASALLPRALQGPLDVRRRKLHPGSVTRSNGKWSKEEVIMDNALK